MSIAHLCLYRAYVLHVRITVHAFLLSYLTQPSRFTSLPSSYSHTHQTILEWGSDNRNLSKLLKESLTTSDFMYEWCCMKSQPFVWNVFPKHLCLVEIWMYKMLYKLQQYHELIMMMMLKGSICIYLFSAHHPWSLFDELHVKCKDGYGYICDHVKKLVPMWPILQQRTNQQPSGPAAEAGETLFFRFSFSISSYSHSSVYYCV